MYILEKMILAITIITVQLQTDIQSTSPGFIATVFFILQLHHLTTTHYYSHRIYFSVNKIHPHSMPVNPLHKNTLSGEFIS